jgi:hypothetical protein
VVTSLHLRGSVFTEPLPRSGLHNPVVLLFRVGTCVCCGRCLAIDLYITYVDDKTEGPNRNVEELIDI